MFSQNNDLNNESKYLFYLDNSDLGNSITFNDLVVKYLNFFKIDPINRTELSRSWQMTLSRIESKLKNFFGSQKINQIDQRLLMHFREHMREQGIKDITIDQYFNVIRKLLKFAYQHQWIDRIPEFPELKKVSVSRGGFSIQEYRKILRYVQQNRAMNTIELLDTCSHKEKREGLYRHDQAIPYEFLWLVRFMVNSFLRPVDIKLIQHKHVQIVRGTHCYLRLSLPETKNHRSKIITLPASVSIYENLKKFMGHRGLAEADDYLFMPNIKDRAIAGYLITKFFRQVLIALNLRKGSLGQNRTLYSLRHTAITFRLLYGKGIDLLTLAKNARTSVEMIERFYASELDPEMNVAMLHSRRSK